MFLIRLPFLFKLFFYLLSVLGLLFLFVAELWIGFIGLFILVFGFGFMDWHDYKLKKFFSYGLFFRRVDVKQSKKYEIRDDLSLVLEIGKNMRELMLELESKELIRIDKNGSISEKSELIAKYKKIESLLKKLNKLFWKYSYGFNLKKEEGRLMYFVYVAAFVYMYDLANRLSKSSNFVVNLISVETDSMSNLLKNLVFPTTQVFWRSGLYVLNNLKFDDKEVEGFKVKFIEKMKFTLGVFHFPFWASVKYYFGLVSLFKQKKWVPFFKSFMQFISRQKIRNGSMAMKKKDVEKVLEIIEPGDIIVARRAITMTGVVIPGYWTHGALYLGNRKQIEQYFKNFSDEVLNKFDTLGLKESDSFVLEAIDKGVTASGSIKGLRADSLVVFKPKLSKRDRFEALLFAMGNLNKEYDYGLNFFSESSFICSELVFKAYSNLRTGKQKLGFSPRLVAGLVFTFSPQDLYEACVKGLDKKLELGICLKHDYNYKKVINVKKL